MAETCTEVAGQGGSGGDFPGNAHTALGGAGDGYSREGAEAVHVAEAAVKEAANALEEAARRRELRENMHPVLGQMAIFSPPLSSDVLPHSPQIELWSFTGRSQDRSSNN